MNESIELLQHLPIASLVTSPSGLVLSYNTAGGALLGVDTAKAPSQKHISDYLVLDDTLNDQQCTLKSNDSELIVRVRSVTHDELTYYFLDDITEQRAKEDELIQFSFTDALSALPNRRHFDLQISKEVSRAQRYMTDLSLLLLDHDKFKMVNDTFGHPTGDKLISWSAQNLCSLVRSADTVYRLGGDEFAIISPALHSDEFSQRIVSYFASTPFSDTGRPVTVSVGVADFTPGLSVTELYTQADESLRLAKNSKKK